MKDIEKRKNLSEVALGNIASDTMITNGTVFNVFTGEFIKRQSIWVKDGMIASPSSTRPENSSSASPTSQNSRNLLYSIQK